jgi:hypothetical protein
MVKWVAIVVLILFPGADNDPGGFYFFDWWLIWLAICVISWWQRR